MRTGSKRSCCESDESAPRDAAKIVLQSNEKEETGGEPMLSDLEKLGDFDTKTSSWVKTPSEIRKLGGAFFMDRRFDTVFVHHSTAPRFFSGNAFRGLLRV